MTLSDITIVGTGIIGATLARAWRQAEREVVIAARDPARAEVRALGEEIGAPVVTLTEGIARSPAVLLAIPGSSMDDLVARVASGFAGKIVIDASNNVVGPVLNGRDAIVAAAPTAHYYRAFNTVGWENFANPRYGATIADLFYCGPEGPTLAVVEGLIEDVGLRPVRVGDRDQVEVVDGLTRLWFALAFAQGRGRGIGFKLLER